MVAPNQAGREDILQRMLLKELMDADVSLGAFVHRHFTVMLCSVLYSILFYSTVLYCSVLLCIAFFCIVPDHISYVNHIF